MELVLSNLYMYDDSISYILNFLMELVTINNLIGLIVFLGFILLSGRAGKALDTVSKITGIAAGGTILYKNWVEGGSSGSGSDDNKKNNDNKDDKKEDNNNNKDDKDKNNKDEKKVDKGNDSNKKN